MDGVPDTRRHPERPRLLLVEDDRELADLLSRLLDDEGYDVDLAADGQAGLHRGLTRGYDILVIDRGLPGVDGLDLTVRLRRQGVDTPVLLLTAYGTVADRVAGLDAGAEDYLVKPFEVEELLARLRALRRRHRDEALRLPIGAGYLDVSARQVRRPDGSEVELSGREVRLLRLLATRPNRVFNRDELRAWAFDDA